MFLRNIRGLLRVSITACRQDPLKSLFHPASSIPATSFKESHQNTSFIFIMMRPASSSSSSSSQATSEVRSASTSNHSKSTNSVDFHERLDPLTDQILGMRKDGAEMFLPKKDNDHFVVCVEGNIGCGKTTLLNYFESMGDCEVIAEPVEKWRSVGGFNPLALMYEDPKRWSLALQTYIQLTMLQIHTLPLTQKVRLMERSIFSAKYCFVDNLFKSGLMHEMEYIILSKWFDWIIESHKVKVDLIVYLRTDPEQLHERIMKRCRQEEKKISLEYLKTLHQLHEDWLIHKKNPCAADVLVLDANTSVEQMKLIYEEHKCNILNSRRQEAQSV